MTLAAIAAFAKAMAAKAAIPVAIGGASALGGASLGRHFLHKDLVEKQIKELAQSKLHRNIAFAAIPAAFLAARTMTQKGYEPAIERSRQVMQDQHQALRQLSTSNLALSDQNRKLKSIVTYATKKPSIKRTQP